MIHIIEDGQFEVWLDTGAGECDGLIVGLADTRHAALAAALREVQAVEQELRRLLAEASEQVKPTRGEG